MKLLENKLKGYKFRLNGYPAYALDMLGLSMRCLLKNPIKDGVIESKDIDVNSISFNWVSDNALIDGIQRHIASSSSIDTIENELRYRWIPDNPLIPIKVIDTLLEIKPDCLDIHDIHVLKSLTKRVINPEADKEDQLIEQVRPLWLDTYDSMWRADRAHHLFSAEELANCIVPEGKLLVIAIKEIGDVKALSKTNCDKLSYVLLELLKIFPTTEDFYKPLMKLNNTPLVATY